jgi:tetratricopeptide (TPR) repeat protein
MSTIVTWFASLQPKDWITLVASTAALVVSLLGYGQRSAEGRIALRKQLTDILQKLADLNTQADTFRALEGKAKRDDYPPNYLGLIGDQRRFLVRQAEFLSRKIRKMVSPYECILIAGTFDQIDDTSQAEQFYARAISEADNALDRGMARRGYARYLFSRGQLDEARKQYEFAVQTFAGETDHWRFYRGNTYERWAAHEREWLEHDRAEQQMGLAIAEFEALENPRRRAYETRRLRQLTTGGEEAQVTGSPP